MTIVNGWYSFKDQSACYGLKGDLSPIILIRKYFTTAWKFRNLQGFLWKTIQAWLGGRSCISHINSFTFSGAVAITTWWWCDEELIGVDGTDVDDMNCAGVVNCACENEDRAGVNVICVGVDLDEICTCGQWLHVCAGVDDVCAAEDVDGGTGITGRPGS